MKQKTKKLFKKLRAFLKRQETDFWDELPDHVKERINQGLEDVAANCVQNHDFVMQEIKARYNIKV